MTTILPDPMTPEQRDAYYEARRFVDKVYPPSLYVDTEWRVQEMALDILNRRFKEATQHLYEMKSRVMLMDLDARVTLVLKDGLLERQDTEPSPQAKKALAALDELIAAEGRRFGIVHGEVHTTPHKTP